MVADIFPIVKIAGFSKPDAPWSNVVTLVGIVLLTLDAIVFLIGFICTYEDVDPGL